MTSPDGALVALSGGVDSAVCALLLQQQGLHVEGVVMEFSPAHAKAVEAALASAQALDIPLHVVRCHELFEREVIDDFARNYYGGRTPNPCIVCNPLVKFALLLQKADELGLGQIATGHYAGVGRQNGRWTLRKSRFLPRDQSYMLYRLTQRQLSRLTLPLEALSKDEVRAIASAHALPCADAPDSQEICFVEDRDYAAFLEERYGPSAQGEFVSPEGLPCGRHRGIVHYTVGQRKGLGVALGRPVFIRRICPESGRIELGEAGAAFFRSVTLADCVWLPFEEPSLPMRLQAKIRSQARPANVLITPLPDGEAVVEFEEPQRAPSPGQSCVLYDGDWVVGGGVICEAS